MNKQKQKKFNFGTLLSPFNRVWFVFLTGIVIASLVFGIIYYLNNSKNTARAASISYGNGQVQLDKKYVQGTSEVDSISTVTGTIITVRLRYNNTANQSATSVSILDSIPTGLTYATGSLKNCYVDGVCVSLSDSLVTGNNIEVAPSSGYFGYANNITSSNLELGRKRYVKLQTDALYSTPYTDLTCNLRADNSPTWGNPSFCGSSDHYQDIMNTDILGYRYLKLQTDDRNGNGFSDRTCNLRAENTPGFGTPSYCADRNTHLDSMITDILGNRYLKLQTDRDTSNPDSERTCNLRSDNDPSFGTPAFCIQRDANTFQMTADLYDGSRGYGYIEYQMNTSLSTQGIVGTSASMNGSFGSITDIATNTIDFIDCTYKYPSNWTLNVVLTDAELRSDQDFTCNFQPKICPHVFYDLDADGLQDVGESNISGQTIDLYREDGITLVTTLTTDSGGLVCFDQLAGGATVYKLTNPNPITPFNTTGGDTQQVILASNDATTIVRFGYSNGSLSLNVPSSVTFPAKNTSRVSQNSCTEINPIEVVDTRLSQAGWSVTAVIDNFTVPNAPQTLPVADKFTSTPGTINVVLGQPGPQVGSTKTVTSTTDPFTIMTAGSGFGKGTYQINNGICQILDPFTVSGNYQTVITYTLI